MEKESANEYETKNAKDRLMKIVKNLQRCEDTLASYTKTGSAPVSYFALKREVNKLERELEVAKKSYLLEMAQNQRKVQDNEKTYSCERLAVPKTAPVTNKKVHQKGKKKKM